jgi:hypothetical protein
MSTRKPTRVRQAPAGLPARGLVLKPEPLPVALRVFTEAPSESEARQPRKRRRSRGGHAQREDRYVLVIDTETTTDRAQRLTFGVARYYRTRRAGGKLVCVDEIIFHDDELPERDPDSYRLLRDYAKYREPAVDWKPADPLTEDAAIGIRLLSASEFRELLYVATYKNRALVVCFNYPFDLSRLAIGWTKTRGGRTRGQRQASSFEGGFTLRYFENPWLLAVAVLHELPVDEVAAGAGVSTATVERACAGKLTGDGSKAERAKLVTYAVEHVCSHLQNVDIEPPIANATLLRKYLDQQNTPPGYKPNRYRPELRIKTIDSKRALKQFSAPHEIEDSEREADDLPFRGHLLDLRTIAFALTDRGHTLESACAAFGVPYKKRKVEHGKITHEYIDYCREDVAATAKLYEAIAAEYRRHPIDLQITKAYSPAAIGKAYLKAMGVKPRLERQPDFPRNVLGWSMCAYYGGRAECRIRRVPVPVVYLDFLSMYPTVNVLMGLSRHVTAARIEVEDATDEIRRLVDRFTVEDCLKPETWKQFVGLVQIKPAGDALPVRARYGDTRSWGIGSSPLHTDEPQWYALPDVVASKLITGRAPEIVRALRLIPLGRQRGLKPVRLRGEVEVDPRTDDFFRKVIELRHQLDDETGPLGRFLKTLANGTSYGIYLEMIPRELPGNQRQDVTVHGLSEQPFTASVCAPERPGEFCFPPLAACITAAARLMLAALEALVTELGGTWVFCDTDSMAVVATEDGGLVPCAGGPHRDEQGRECVRALSWAQVDEIVKHFESLNPYNPDLVPGSVLEIEAENRDAHSGKPRQLYCYSISAKRYALNNLDQSGRPVLRRIIDADETEDSEPEGDEPGSTDSLSELRKHSEHGLGHLLNPIDPESDSREWIAQLWEYIIRTDALGQDAPEPDWLDRPALTRSTITSPRLEKPFDDYNRKRPVSERIRPYNFLLAAHAHKRGLQGLPERFLLVAPYESDPRKWRRLKWHNAYDSAAGPYTIKTARHGEDLATRSDDQVIVKSYRDVLDDYRTHPEHKSLGPDGQPCDRQTIGLLSRRPIKVATIHYIGKESKKIEEAPSWLVADLDDALTEYRDPERDPLWQLVLDMIRMLPVAQTAEGAGVSARTVKRARAGGIPQQESAREARRLCGQARAHAASRRRHPAAGRPRSAARDLSSDRHV